MARSDVRRIGGLLATLALGVYLFSAGGSLTTTDAVVTFDVTQNLVEHGSVAMSGNLLDMDAHRGKDGRYYSPFGIGQSVYNVPFYIAGRTAVAAGFAVAKPDSVPKAAVALGQTLVAAAIVWEFYLFAVALTGDVSASALSAATLAFGTLLWPYAKFGFNQPLACLTLLAAVRRVYIGRESGNTIDLIAAGLWLSASLLTRHEMVIAAAPIAVWLAVGHSQPLRDRMRRLVTFALPVAGGVAVWLAFNAWRFGNPLDSGYLRDPQPGFGAPIVSGLLGLLFSPSASIFLYSPVTIAGVAGLFLLGRRDRTTAAALVSLAGLFALFYATLGNWLAGRSYGSRYLLVVLPLVVLGWAASLARLPRRRQTIAGTIVLVVGALVQLPGIVVDYAKVNQAATASTGAVDMGTRQWDWRAAPIVMNVRAAGPAVLRDNFAFFTLQRKPPMVMRPEHADDRSFSQQFAFSLDFWWLYLYYMNVLPAWGVIVLVTAFAAWAAGASVHLARQIRAITHRKVGV